MSLQTKVYGSPPGACARCGGGLWTPDPARQLWTSAMDEPVVWETIATAPYDRDLELAVIEGDHVHPLVFACRRGPSGWIKVATRERIPVSPTHRRPWRKAP